MAITSAVSNTYKQSVMKGWHRSGDTYKMALYVAAATLDGTTSAYTATNEVASGGGYTTGGATLAGFSVSLSTNTARLTFTTPTWPTSTITARGAMIYNTSSGTNGGAANEMVAVVNFGSDISSSGGTFTVTLPLDAITLT
jgi:hypothetical protein